MKIRNFSARDIGFHKWLLLAGLLVAGQANAAFIGFDTYFRDVTSGLEWKKLTLIAGLSYNYIVSQMDQPGEQFYGWRYATGQEFDEVMGNFSGAPMSCPAGYSYDYCGWSTENNGLALTAAQWFGDMGAGLNLVTYGRGMLAEVDSAGNQWVARFSDYVAAEEGEDYVHTHADSWAQNGESFMYSSFLVREVPLPAAAWLFLSAIGGLGIIKRKRS